MTDAELPDFELPDMPAIDESAIRKAVRRGVLRVAFTAAAWLLLALVVGTIGIGAVTVVHTRPFAEVVDNGILASHPEYEFNGMSCCGGLTSVTVRHEGHVRGDVDGSAQVVVEVRRSLFGNVEIDDGEPSETPVGRALSRGPATKDATRALLAKLPDSVVASAVVELERPLPYDQVQSTIDAAASAVLLTRPYENEPLVSWPADADLSRFTSWAGDLRADNDELLAALDLPPSATLRGLAQNPQVYAVVIDRATPAQLRSLLGNQAVRGLNLADIAFDPAVPVTQ